jgi:hypothetical protein
MKDNISDLIDKILWGKSFAQVKDSDNEGKIFILRSLTIQEANLIKFIRDQEYEKSLFLGIMTNDELKEAFDFYDIWTEIHENRFEDINLEVKRLQATIKNTEFFPTKQKQARRQLKKLQKELEELTRIKFNLYTNSAESRADEIMRRHMVRLSTEDINESPYWPSKNDFMLEEDTFLIYNLALAYYQNNIFDVTSVRKVGRSPEWRYRWNASKNGADLFGRPIPQWSEMQNALVYWSQFYDFVLENPDRPPDFIVHDDDACDAWVNDQMKKHNRGLNTKTNHGKGQKEKNFFGNKKATTTKDHQEQFIMVQPGDENSVKKLQEMNTNATRQQLRREHKAIEEAKNKGQRITEWQLRKRNYV